MACVCQPLMENVKGAFNARFPNRDKATDGCCASAQHTQQNPTSGHEAGIALDVDADLRGDLTMHEVTRRLAAMMLVGEAGWCDYLIYNGQIFNPEIATFWRPYHGSNPHTSHVHIEGYWSWRGHQTPLNIFNLEELVGEQADRIEAKVDKLIEITAKRGVLARVNARLKSVLSRETARTEANAAGRK